MLQPHREPHASSAAEVENALYGKLLGQMANDVVRRYCGSAVGSFKEAVVVSVQLKKSQGLAGHWTIIARHRRPRQLRGAAVDMRVVRPHEPVSTMSLVEQH